MIMKLILVTIEKTPNILSEKIGIAWMELHKYPITISVSGFQIT